MLVIVVAAIIIAGKMLFGIADQWAKRPDREQIRRHYKSVGS